MNIHQILLISLIMSALTACSKSMEATTRALGASNSSYANGDLPPSIWKSTSVFPLDLKYSGDFTQNEIDALQAADQSWSDSINNQIDFFDTASVAPGSEKSSLSSYNDNTFGIYKHYTWPTSLPTTALAVTQIYGQRRNVGSSSEYIQITHADILVNYEYYSFSTDGTFGYDLETVMLHEMGHFIGLYHDESSTAQSVMYPTVNRDTNNRNPRQNDIESLSSKYLSSGSNSIRSSRRSMDTDQSEQESGESVQIIFELNANGSENIYVNNKLISSKKCNHKNNKHHDIHK